MSDYYRLPDRYWKHLVMRIKKWIKENVPIFWEMLKSMCAFIAIPLLLSYVSFLVAYPHDPYRINGVSNVISRMGFSFIIAFIIFWISLGIELIFHSDYAEYKKKKEYRNRYLSGMLTEE